jgi:predicted 2-oxoglutarate/Fe(II)-dependent dioxygenase YbiX
MEDINRSVYLFKNFMQQNEVAPYIERIKNKYSLVGNIDDFNTRTIEISQEPIVEKVKQYIESQLPVKLNCSQAQIQIWPEGSGSELHIHDHKGRERGDFNSLIYLNNDFDDGEFITDFSKYKPEVGTLTFFNGKENYHGVTEVKKAHRFTLIFWWQNTIILES